MARPLSGALSPGICGRAGRRSRQYKAQAASAVAASLRPLTDSPKSRKAANSGMNRDRRCAASLRTMPAWRTAAAMARNTLGRSTPNAASTSHGVCGASSAAASGRSTVQQSRAATA